TRQLDFVFVSAEMEDRVKVRAMNTQAEWGPSDHARLLIEITCGTIKGLSAELRLRNSVAWRAASGSQRDRFVKSGIAIEGSRQDTLIALISSVDCSKIRTVQWKHDVGS
ncbi:MAG: hypothetical protein V3V49_15105, partial [Candidatus Krumholzibacteria bacterium]